MSEHSFQREAIPKYQQLLNKEKYKMHQSVLLNELKNEQIYMKKERTYWTIGEEVVLLKYIKYCENEQKEITWESLKPKLRKKDVIECRKRFEEIRNPKFGEYEKPEDIIDKSWNPIKENILYYSYLKYNGNLRKIQRRLNEFEIPELEQKIQELKTRHNFDKYLGICNEYKLIEKVLKNKSIAKLENGLNKTNDELLNHLGQIIENFRNEKQIQKLPYLDESEKENSYIENSQIMYDQVSIPYSNVSEQVSNSENNSMEN